MLRNVNESKTGQIWHKGKASTWKMPYMPGWPIATDNLCPFCGKPDSQSHILGGCAHPDMKKMVIYRHDEAHRSIINAINKGNLGSFAMVADVDTAASLGNLILHLKRIVWYYQSGSYPTVCLHFIHKVQTHSETSSGLTSW